MKRALLFLILGITIQSHAYSEAELDKEIETRGDDIKSLELTCEKRKVLRNYIALLENIENSKEFMELIKEDTRFIEHKMYIKKTKENWQKYIDRDDERVRKMMNVKPEIKIITLDYVCRAWGY